VKTWAAHSSVAVELLLLSLAAGHVITPIAAIALVPGANLGGATPPVLEAPSADPAARRLPMGNLAFWGLGCLVALPFARPIAEALWTIDPDPTTAVVNFQTALHPKQRFLLGLLPE
jgi:phosphate:Na+ symporter